MSARPFGCEQCFGDDGERAWIAIRRAHVAALVEESHFSVRLTACACGQRFAVVFAERIDWSGGEDDMTWLAAPISVGEAKSLEAQGWEGLASVVSGRRFLLRCYPTKGGLTAVWREGGFTIPWHD